MMCQEDNVASVWTGYTPSTKLQHYILLRNYQSLLPIGQKLQRYEMDHQGRDMTDSITTSSIEKM
jgi:hypothetical protein